MSRKKAIDADIIALRNEGLTIKQIAICLNLHPTIVAKHLSKLKKNQNLLIKLKSYKIRLPPQKI